MIPSEKPTPTPTPSASPNSEASPMTVAGWRDWIESFLEFTNGTPSPRIFRLWSAISAVGAALERRVWVHSAGEQLFPTLYVLLVGRPGSGKSQAIRPVSALWYSTKELCVASNSVTKASLIDELEDAKRLLLIGNEMLEYHSLQIAASEFGVLVTAHDLVFLSFLNQIYDNDPSFRESRRTSGKKTDIINPQINLLAGTQPAYLATLLPDEAWGMGFMTRIIMVYSGETCKTDIFSRDKKSPDHFRELSNQLKELLKAHGECDWEEAAREAVRDWILKGCIPIPDHSRLEAYNERRVLHIIRLCIISAASSGHPLLITLNDFIRARDWLLDAELAMPDIFKAMVNKSDAQVIADLHQFVWSLYARSQKPVHEARIIYFLQAKVTSDKIPRILDTVVRANILDRLADGVSYVPRAKHEHGVE